MLPNIVFIDDEKDLCELYELLFESENHTITTFSDPDDFVGHLKDNQVDLCFIDYRMPRTTGVELRKSIANDIPCILLTGELDMDSAEGFVSVLKKPINSESFQSTIDKFLKK